jgi:hypothetical protein
MVSRSASPASRGRDADLSADGGRRSDQSLRSGQHDLVRHAGWQPL